MSVAPYHTPERFLSAVRLLLEKAEKEGRATDLDRVVKHLDSTPKAVNPLASLMMLLDEDWRIALRDEIEAYRRWGKQKEQPVTDDTILASMRGVYDQMRNG